MTATFLSQIEVSASSLRAGYNLTLIQPTDLVNQSIPFSFLSMEVSSNDGQPHRVQLYTEVNGQWLGKYSEPMVWETTTGRTVNHRFWLKNQTRLTEVNGMIGDGSITYSTKQVTHFREIGRGLSQNISAQRNDVQGWR